MKMNAKEFMSWHTVTHVWDKNMRLNLKLISNKDYKTKQSSPKSSNYVPKCTSRTLPYCFGTLNACLLCQVNAVTAQSTTCLKTVPYLGCGGKCTVFRSRWGSLRRPNNPRNRRPNLPSLPSLSSPQHMQGSRWGRFPHSSLPACLSPPSSVTLDTIPLISVCSGWCRRPSWLVCRRRSSMFLSSTGSWWRTRHTRRHWWLTF